MKLLKKMHSNTNFALFIIALPGVLHFIIFKYIPLAGNIIAFQEYNIFQGLRYSPWVGFEQFRLMFTYDEFYQMLRNTLLFSLLNIVFGFPAPLILSMLLNEVRKLIFKRTVQTMLYLPHFLSWVIIGGIFINFLDIDGIVNQFLGMFGVEPIYFLTLRDWFRPIIVSIGIWKEVGWGTIIYLAALAGINPNLYEAAVVDGAGRWKQMWHITIPALMPAIVVLFLLRLGNVAEANVEQILIFLNPLVRDVGEVVDTYVYRLGIEHSLYSLTTAIGIFQSIIGIALIVTFNKMSKKITGESIY